MGGGREPWFANPSGRRFGQRVVSWKGWVAVVICSVPIGIGIGLGAAVGEAIFGPSMVVGIAFGVLFGLAGSIPLIWVTAVKSSKSGN